MHFSSVLTFVSGKTVKIYGADVVILEGLFVLYEPTILAHLDIKIFVDTEDDIRLARRCKPDPHFPSDVFRNKLTPSATRYY